MAQTRLDKYLSHMGWGSRQEIRHLVKSKRVMVNQQLISEVSYHVQASDRVTVDGKKVGYQAYTYILLHKPAGVITATTDPKLPTVMDLLPEQLPNFKKLSPVGRLDRDTTGLLVLTNDGTLNHRLLSPHYHVAKTYEALVTGKVTKADSDKVRLGLVLTDFTTLPAELSLIAYDIQKDQSYIRLILHEGKYHQVKRMMASLGHPVMKLHRPVFGPLTLPPQLAAGAWQELTAKQVAKLYAVAQLEQPDA